MSVLNECDAVPLMVINSNLPPTTSATSAPAGPAGQTLAADLNIRINQVVQAQVIRLMPVSESDRQALLAARASMPAQAAVDPMNNILQSPNLRLAQLSVEGKLLSALTNLPLQPRQMIPVMLDRQGQLQWIPSATTVPKAVATSAAQPQLSAQSSLTTPLSAAEPRAVHPLQLKLQEPLMRQASDLALAGALRRALPHAQPMHQLLNAAKDWVEQSPARAVETAPQPVRALASALRTLIQQAPTPAKLASEGGAVLKLAIRDSGIGLERQLAQTGTTTPPERDAKLLLIRALHALADLGYTSSIARPSLEAASRLDRALESLLMPFLPPRTPSVLQSRDEATATTKQQLQRLTALADAALSQVQLSQYRTTSAQATDGGATGSFFTEVPIRLADGFVTVIFQFQEIKEPEKKRKSGHKHEARRSRWVVFMEMSIQDHGKLAVEVSVVERQVDAQFWSDNNDLRDEAEQKLRQLRQQLESQGLTVTDLRCSQAPMPQKNVRLDYSLIDVKT